MNESRKWTTDAKQNGAILREAILTIAGGLSQLSDEELGLLVVMQGTEQLDELLAVADMIKASER